MRSLSLNETKLASGAFAIPGAVAGGLTGAGVYLGQQSGPGGNFTWGGFGTSVGTGVVVGFFGGPVGLGAAFGGTAAGVWAGGVEARL